MDQSIFDRKRIAHRRTGKWIVGAKREDEAALLAIKRNAELSGAQKLEILPQKEILSEPQLHAVHVLSSPSSGIIDSHAYMASLVSDIQAHGSDLVLNHEVVNIEKSPTGSFKIDIKPREGSQSGENDVLSITTDVIVNAAGLRSDHVARLILGDKIPKEYQLYYMKGCAGRFLCDKLGTHTVLGHYFAYRGPPLLSQPRLIYPLPEAGIRTLGVHATIDLSSAIKFGPDKLYIERNDADPSYVFVCFQHSFDEFF